GADIAFGPGKAELLESISATHSLSQAAKAMGMSYMKAWLLIKLMNRSFNEPLVQCERGGARGGGAELTATGERVLALYQEMHRATVEAIEEPWKEVQQLMTKL
ncbi:MAG TPA: LysR family transcriptional regulator, partial [Chthoniobacterales bacterium]|nr:LysR family transcriptional regulator [Chthoniobacterales bacterium]